MYGAAVAQQRARCDAAAASMEALDPDGRRNGRGSRGRPGAGSAAGSSKALALDMARTEEEVRDCLLTFHDFLIAITLSLTCHASAWRMVPHLVGRQQRLCLAFC